MKWSSNPIAETLVKAMAVHAGGSVGSWASGMRVVHSRLVSLGLSRDEFALVDGSGLSYENRVSPRAFVHALAVARDSFEFGPELVAALPISALDGTLEKRIQEAVGEARAKTGLLTRVTSLSGLVRLGSGEIGIFSIIANGYRRGDRAAMDALDLCVAELVSRPGGVDAEPPPVAQEGGAGWP